MKKLSARMRAARQRREHKALTAAIAQFGSITALARALGVTYQAVQDWFRKRVPLERCPQIELMTCGRVQCEQLREDFTALSVRPYRQAIPADAVYLSGPMTGIAELNYPAFNAEAARLRNLGLRVVNPAEVQLPPDATWTDFMRVDIANMVACCDTVVTLPGWERSKGARIEVGLARQLDLRVVSAGAIG